MNTINFSVGYNGRLEDLKRIVAASDKIGYVYTGGLAGKIAGGRPQYLKSMDALAEQVDFAHKNGIKFEIALNSPCGFESKSNKKWWDEIKKYIKDLESNGIDSITVSHPFLMQIVKENTNMILNVSTICEISTVRSALYYEQLGADVITPSMNVNYDLETLELMSKKLKKAKLKIMVNEHCLGDCPWRRFHHNHYAHSNVEFDYHYHCKSLFLQYPYLLLTNNSIRPEDIDRYFEITESFKIVGRLVPIDDLIMRIKAYSRRYYKGNYVALFDTGLSRIFSIPNEELDDLFSHKVKCNKICEECGYCIELEKKLNVRIETNSKQ